MKTQPALLAALLTLASGLPAGAALPDAGWDSSTRLPTQFYGDIPTVPSPIRYRTGQADQADTRWGALSRYLAAKDPEIPQAAVRKVLGYLQRHPVPNMDFVTIIDMDLPSTARRMYVISLATGKVERFLVAHGSGSGMLYATRFSDVDSSHMTSLGLYLTLGEDSGKHGRDLKLAGLEDTNRHAQARAIELHGASYVSDSYIRQRGRLGRSWGCPAVDFAVRDHIIG
ncbi:MAG: murein L,D-transpeptidase catalytic domain family protein, partial [Elusimicrobia bacterium]|nr:murein L,D-transpeptidase catalytic domain family protein [Elusimicrobiota bacterium]